MEGDSSSLVRSTALEMDKALSSVMPSSWEGHARIAIRNSDSVPESIEEKTIEKANNIADKKGVSPERAANSLIKHIADKMD
jgi:hypothetical protein